MIRISKLENKFQLLKRRVTASFLIVAFLVSLLVAPPDRLASAEIFPSIPESVPSKSLSVELPKQWGQIQEEYIGSSDQRVILIQDAHALPEAQANIENLIHFLHEKHGVSLVMLEGASVPLDPQIFRSFPDRDALKRVFRRYQQRGELTGGTSAAIFADPGIEYQGAEDWTLYEEGLRIYLKSMQNEKSLSEKISKKKEQLTEQKKRVYSQTLFEADQALDRFQENLMDLAEVLGVFESIQPPPKGSELELLLNEIHRKDEVSPEIKAEIHRAADKIKLFLETSPKLKQELWLFNQQFQEFQISRISPEAFILFLEEASQTHHVKLKLSPRLKSASRQQKKMQDIQGTRFFEDFERYTQLTKEILLTDEHQQALDQQTQSLRLIERLARLELSYLDWERIRGMNLDSELLPELRSQLDFYENAQKREAVFFKKIAPEMKVHGSQTAVFVAGGFHAGGLTRQLREAGVSYMLVTPQIGSIPKNNPYRNHMKGDVSWRGYFEVERGKVSIYKAFVRASRDELIQESQDRTGLLKKWRDQIIRDLAGRGQITRAGEYTRFIDETTQERTESLRKQWSLNVENFLGGLRDLKGQGALTEKNIQALLTPSMIVATEGAVLASADQVAAALLPSARLRVSIKEKTRIPHAVVSGRSEVRHGLTSQIDLDQETSALVTPKEIVVQEVLMPLLLENGVAEKWGIGIANAYLDTLALIFGNGREAVNYFFEQLSLSPEKTRLRTRVQKMLQQRLERAVSNKDPVFARQILEVVPAEIYRLADWGVGDSYQQALRGIESRPRITTKTEVITLKGGVIHVELASDATYGKNNFFVIKGDVTDFVYFPARRELLPLGDNQAQAVYRFQESSDRLFSEPSPLLFIEKQANRISFRTTGFWESIRITPVFGKDFRGALADARSGIAEAIALNFSVEQATEKITARSEVRSATVPTIEAVGFFPGFEAWKSYLEVRDSIYQTDIPQVQKVYLDVARALGFFDMNGQPDPSRIFSMDFTAADKDENGLLAASMIAHNLALHAYFQVMAGDQAEQTMTKFTAYTGENFGILTAAIATEAISLADGIKLAMEFTPCLQSCESKEEYQVYSISHKNIASVLKYLHGRMDDDFEVRQTFSEGVTQRVEVYVPQSKISFFLGQMVTAPKGTQYWAEGKPTRLTMHSKKMKAARDRLDDFVNEQGIEFSQPKTPILSNNNMGIIRDAADVARAVFGIIDEPMNSKGTVRLMDLMEADLFIEMGMGKRGEILADENFAATPFFAVDKDLLDENLFKTLKSLGDLKETVQGLKNGEILELKETHYRTLRNVFQDIDGNDFAQKMLFRYIALTVKTEILNDFAKKRPEVFYRFMEILQNTYLAQVVLNMSVISSDTLVLSLIFKKKLEALSDSAVPPIDIELLTYDRKGREVELSFLNYRYLESITYAFSQLSFSAEELAYLAEQLMETQPLAQGIYEHLAERMNLPGVGYFTDTAGLKDSKRYDAAVIAYQYTLFEVLKLHKPALFGQNFYYVTATDDLGMAVAMAASESLPIEEAILFYQRLLEKRRQGEGLGDLVAVVEFKEPAIKIYDPQSQGLVRRVDQMPDMLASFSERPDPNKPLSLAYESRIITFNPEKTIRIDSEVDPENVIHIEGLYDAWQRHANPQLDMLEDLSILRLTDQNGKVYRFAEGIGTTTANVYAYIRAGEEVLDFFKGGSGSLTMKLKTREGKIIVRKVLSERFTAHWEGTGVMMGQHTKALAQTDYLQNLPAELGDLFPKVLGVQKRDLPIPPNNPDHDQYHGVYHELIYDMEFMPGMDVSHFIHEYQPPPAAVARLDTEIFRVLRQKIHVHRAAAPAAEETLEESYLTKIEKRLALSQKELPQVFNTDILEPATIEIDGEVYRNIRPILQTLRDHPEYLKLLEPQTHSLVIGDTNTENIRISNPSPIVEAIKRGDSSFNFTAEEIGIKFFDPRSIGFRTQGGATVDDRMYDNKPIHNITLRDGRRRLGNYDEIHAEYFDVQVQPSSQGSKIDVRFHENNPYAQSYAGMEKFFKQILSDAWNIDDPDSEFVQQDPYWLIRLVFLMGTHFAAMPPFHVTKEIDGSKIDDYEHQKRPIALYAEGIKWLNIALDMLEQNRTDFLGVELPPLPFAKHESTAPAQLAPEQTRTTEKVKRSEVRNLTGPEAMSSEARLFFSPWSRLARGTGLGPHTIDYDAVIAGHIRKSFEVVAEKVPETHAYNQFSRLLVELILDAEDPDYTLQKVELEERTEKILAVLGQETGAYQYATAAAILMDAYAKLGLDAGLLINDKYDLAQQVLDRIETIPFKNDGIYGYYERVTAYTSLFISMGQLGIAERLVSADKNYVNMALQQLETIPSPWNRGRGSSMLFAALKVLGYERFLWEDGKDYVKDTLDYIDRAEELNIWPTFPATQLTHAYFTIEPYLTTLNAISILGHPEYLNYRMDRITKVNEMMQRLSPEETALIGEYYLLTLYNLGVLDQVIPDLDGYLRQFAGLMETIKPAPLWFPNGVAYPYAMETLWFFGRSELITDDMVDRMDNSLTEFTDSKDVTNWGHPLSYILNTHAQLGTLDRIFETQPQDNPVYGKEPVMEWGIRHFAGDTAGFQKSLPMFDHTLISLSLRMRGRNSNESKVYENVKFMGGRSEVRHEEDRLPSLTSRLPGLDNEGAVLINGWNRISRGMGIGMFPTSYDVPMAKNLWKTAAQLDRIDSDDAYNIFSNKLTRFILERVNPVAPLPDAEIPARTTELRAALQAIPGDLLYVNASAIFFETFAKLGLDPVLFVNREYDMVEEALLKVRDISAEENVTSGPAKAAERGSYDQLAAYTHLFMAVGHLGMKEKLLQPGPIQGNYIESALSLMEGIPSPSTRGRYAAAFFSTLKVLGYENYIFENAAQKNYLAETLDYLDDDQHYIDFDQVSITSLAYKKAYPAMLMLIALGVLGEKDYLMYKKDRLVEAKALLGQLEDKDSIAKHVTLYLTALSNLGELSAQVPDLNIFLKGLLPKLLGTSETKFLAYAHELLWLAGRQDLASEQDMSRWIEILDVPYASYAKQDREAPYHAAFMLTILGQYGHEQAQRLFVSDPAFGNQSPFERFISDFKTHPSKTKLYLPMLNHALINYALRMRGTDKDSKLFKTETAAALPVIQEPQAAALAQGEEPTFLLKGETFSEQEEYLRREFAQTPLQREVPGRGRFITSLRLDRKKSTKSHFYAVMETSLGQTIDLKFGSRDPAADEIVVHPFFIKWGDENRQLPVLQAAYAIGHLPSDILLTVLKILKENGVARIEEPLGIPGSDRFFERVFGVTFQKYHTAPPEQVYSIRDSGFNVEDGDGGWVPVKMLTVHFENLKFPDDLWPEDKAKVAAKSEVRHLKSDILSQIRSKKLSAGMHIPDIQGKTPDEIVSLGRMFEANGIYPEIGASEEGLQAIRIYREHNPHALIAAGEIEESNVERALAAVRAGADILVALENPLSAAVVRAVRELDPNVVIIASAQTEEEAELSIQAGVDGIKIRPFALPQERIPESLKLLRTLRQKYPNLLLGGSRGIQPQQLPELLEAGLEFVGLGVQSAVEGSQILARQSEVQETRLRLEDPAGQTMAYLFEAAHGLLLSETPLLAAALNAEDFSRAMDLAAKNFLKPFTAETPAQELFVILKEGYLRFAAQSLARRGDDRAFDLSQALGQGPLNYAQRLPILKKYFADETAEFINQLLIVPHWLNQFHDFLVENDREVKHVKGYSDLPKEFKAIHSPWMRLARGMGLGAESLGYDAQTEQRILEILNSLDAKISENQPYHYFSSLLIHLILDANRPGFVIPAAELQARVSAIVAALKQEKNPYDYTVGASILVETLAKLRLPSDLLIQAQGDFIPSVLAAIETIQPKKDGGAGYYERVSAYGTFFLALGHSDLENQLRLIGEDVFQRPLDLLAEIPAPWNRGRAASVLFSGLKAVGEQARIVSPGHDYIGETMDVLDQSDESYSGLSKAFFKVFPLLTLLNAVADLAEPGLAADYKSYKMDRIAQARGLMESLSPIEKMLMTQYYLMALANLGELEKTIPDLSEYLKDFASLTEQIQPEGNWFPNGVALAYAVETLWFFGQSNLISESLIQRIMTALPANYTNPKFAVNRDNPMAYVLNAFEELGITESTFFSTSAGGRKPIEALVESLTSEEALSQKGVYAFDHALINMALRRRSEVRGQATDRNLDPESKMFGNGWIRMSQGAALGAPATKYDPQAADYLRQMITVLDEKVPASDTYNHFSMLLAKFILDIVNPELTLSDGIVRSRTIEIVTALQAIESSLLYVNASTLLFESFGKLGLANSLLVNKRQDLVRDSLERVGKITSAENTTTPSERNKVRGPYDQLIAYQQLFQSLGQLKLQDRLEETLPNGRNYIEQALSLIEQIPSAFARGRYASVLFITLKNIGYENFIFDNKLGRDHLKELLDYMDNPQAFETIPGTSPLYSQAYAFFLTLSAIGVLGRPEYLNYSRDRVEQARELIRQEQLEGSDEEGKQTMLYLLALSNLGVLESAIPDLDAYLEDRLKTAMEAEELSSDPLYTGRNLGYTIETVFMLGRRDLITPEALDRWVSYLNTEKYPIEGRTYPYNAAFTLTVLGELGEAARLFEGQKPLLSFLESFLDNRDAVERYLPFIAHAVLNYSLRMRGAKRSEVRTTIGLDPEPILRQTPGTRLVRLEEIIEATGMSDRIRSDKVFLIPPTGKEKERLINELNEAISEWVADRNQRRSEDSPFAESELEELIVALVENHRLAIESLAREFEDDEAFPGNASVGIGGRMGQPTIFINGWKKGKPSRTHDHGESKAAYHVLRGKLKETTYIPTPDGKFLQKDQILQEGSTLSMSPPYIHQVQNGNEDDSRTISINAYAPQLVLMNRYGLKDGELVFADQWVDDEVVHEVLISHTAEDGFLVGIEIGAIQDWQKDEVRYPGYTRNALAMTLLFTLLEEEGALKADLIKNGYSIETLNLLYRSGAEGEAIFRKIQSASRMALQRQKGDALQSFEDGASAFDQELQRPEQESEFSEDEASTVDAFLEALRPEQLSRSEIRVIQNPWVLEVPSLVMKMGVDEFAGLALSRLDAKLQELETAPEAELVDPKIAKGVLGEIKNVLQGLLDEKYTMGYVALDDNRSFVDGIKQIGSLIERLIIYSDEGKVSPEFSQALRERDITYTLERSMGKRSRSTERSLGGQQKFVGVVMPGDIHFDANTQQVLVPIKRNAETQDPLLDTVGMALQAAVALLLAREATDLRKKNHLLLHPEELLKKYELFSGYENQILRSDGAQGFIISSRAIQTYLADQAIKQSA